MFVFCFQVELSNVDEYKKRLLQLNVAVHRFLTENEDYNVSSLKTDVSELYRIWNEIYNRLAINYFIRPLVARETRASTRNKKVHFK